MKIRFSSPRSFAATVGAMSAVVLVLAACGGDDTSPSAGGSDEGGEQVSLSILVDNAPANVAKVEALGEAYTAENPNVEFDVEQRPGGGEGDNLVKTRLSTGDMTELFYYNSGSLLQALAPNQTLTPLTDQPWVDDLVEPFPQTVTVGDELFGAPIGTSFAGAVLYNIPLYEELGLEIPTTWEEFMANNEVIAQESEAAPVVQTYQDTWTSQIFVLGDFANVLAADPDWAEKYTANEVKYATDEAALQGFQHLQDVYEAGYLNEDFASATFVEGVGMVAAGEGAHYPMLSSSISEVQASNPEQVDDVGLFAIPGDDSAANNVTIWAPDALYLPASTEGAQRDAALDFLEFVVSPEACDVMSEAATPTGPYLVEGCELPEDVPQVATDLQEYFDEGRTNPALEFLSPIKGPALEQITVEVGSGIRDAEEAAALYDDDVEKQAQQLGLEGW